MRVSYEWLSEFVDLSGLTPDDIAHSLTMSGLEVDEIEVVAPKFTNIITAKILNIKQHPDANKLSLATIDTGKEQKTVVCGAQNIATGQIVPYASVGSKVFSKKTGELFELVPTTIRGVVSEGMLCSEDELALNELGLEQMQKEDGILILDKIFGDIPLGKPLEEVLGLHKEVIFHTAPTANRGDQMSVLGVAREISALWGRKLNFSPIEYTGKMSDVDFKVEITDPETCKYYSVGILKDLTIKPSPDFIKRRITACGIRPINNIVDITNYVLLEYGTPLHAFDYDKLNKYLCVRYAHEGEEIVTIDGTVRKLTPKSVLIAKEDAPVCLAGVFGGANSEVDADTKNIALEAAYFMPATTRKSARSVGYRSEASARFERGVDIKMVKAGLLRAIQLLSEHADAKFEGIVETGSNEPENIEITLRGSEISRVLGIDIEQEKCIEILQNLGFEFLGGNEMAAKLKVPSARVDDVRREIDVIEEVLRIYGYDKIAPTLPPIVEGATISEEAKTLKCINELFLGCGFSEIVTSSFIGESSYKNFSTKFDSEKSVKVLNPQSEELSMLRQSLVPSLLEVVKYNFDNGNKNLRLYEIGKTYTITDTPTEKSTGILEARHAAGAIFGNVNNELWNTKAAPDFFTLKGVLESLFEELGLQKRIVFDTDVSEWEFLHPAQSAHIKILGKNTVSLGFLGKLHPILKDKMKLNQELYIFELNLEHILNAHSPSLPKYKKLPHNQAVQRDTAFILPKDTSCEDILKIIKKAADKNIYKNAQVFDIYQGSNIEAGKKSMAVRITLLDESVTLKDEIINQEISKIKAALEKSVQGLAFRE
ncbi:phenylalanyl-tRNA synthetase beta chain [Candidatus Gastranaerophilus sp. (ex Termes propinquus)]|nr:phenylalanyl-tRNA synthetase beta chain [Candidatus Gastranaerophilus sp. (ex Termes propinquus)]